MLYFVGAHDQKFGMGNKGNLPWPRMATDLKRFHALTKNKTVLMGERTYREYASIRHVFGVGNIYVVSRTAEALPDATVLRSLEEVPAKAEHEDIWAIGGGSIFKQLLPSVDVMYLTLIDGVFEADTFFPEYHEADWEILQKDSFPADADNPFAYTFLTLKRR